MKLNLKIVAATAAVAMMSSGAAFAAASITAPATNFSKEGLTLTGTGAVTLPAITVTFGNNLTYQDDVIITVSSAVSLTAIPTPGLVTCSGSATLGYVTTVSNGWAFRVTSVAGLNLGDTCVFQLDATPGATGLQVQGASLVSNPTLNYKALRFGTGQQVDTATNSAAFLVRSQFGITNGVGLESALVAPLAGTALNGTIDVYKDRLAFTDDESVAPGSGAAFPDRADTLNWSTTVDRAATVFYGPTVITTAQTVALVGGFAWADANSNGTCTAGELGAAIPGNAGWTISASSTCNVVVLNGPVGNTANTSYFYVPGSKILNPTDWTGTAEWNYKLSTDASKTGTTQMAWDPGIWTINGAQVYIQYMPYGENISRIIYAANRGPIDATVDIDMWYDGSKKTCSNAAAVNNETVTKLSQVVDDCANAQFSLTGTASGKVAILLTFTAPDKDIEVYSAYNVGTNDRGTVVNTSNGRSFYYGLGL